MPKKEIIGPAFREGRLAFLDDLPVSENPYTKINPEQAQAWDAGWRGAEKDPEATRTNLEKTSRNERRNGGFWKSICAVIALGIAVNAGIALFGDWFEASRSVMKDTAKAREELSSALYQVFGEFGRLEVREDYSVRAYISKKNYMSVSYPDRDEVIRQVGRAWCEDEKISKWYLPKLRLRDIETGEQLGRYGCLTGWVSRK